ncbi:MAG: cysteine--tRNA ligase [archaeon]
MKTLRIYNTLGRQKQDFVPLQKGKVGMYTCGPTVYSDPHIGNLRTYIFEDILRRTLEYLGYEVKHVQNITDVGHLTSDADTGEDKIEKSAREKRKTAWEIAEYYTKKFYSDIEKLNIEKPTIICKATEHIKEQVEFIKKIEENGYTYIIENDGVYFDTSKLPVYGELIPNFDQSRIKPGARVEFAVGKRNPCDFALWKFSPKDKKRDMEWDSPWGVGFPGWHIECSAMGVKYLGEVFDIHCGGVDHIPIHHTNEIAQSRAAYGKNPARYWVHVEFLQMGKEKMSKSLGNIITLENLEKEGINPISYRYWTLTSHYRSQSVFSLDAVKAAQKNLERLYEFIRRLLELIEEKKEEKEDTKIEDIVSKWLQEFEDYLFDDLNTPKIMALLNEIQKEVNMKIDDKSLSKADAKLIYDLFLKFDKVLGLKIDSIRLEEIPAEIKELLAARELARKEKDFKKSDELRNKLKELGWEVMDTPEGQKVKKITN